MRRGDHLSVPFVLPALYRIVGLERSSIEEQYIALSKVGITEKKNPAIGGILVNS